MLKEAIQFLMNCDKTSDLPATHIPTIQAPESMTIRSLEAFGVAPVFHRAHFTTARLTDFNAYLAKEANGPETAVFIDANAAGATAIVDMGTHDEPGWGRHTAKLAMTKTPEFAALESACKNPMDQRALITFLEDYGELITPAIRAAGAETVTNGTIAQAIAIIRKIEVNARKEGRHSEDDYARTAEGMESIEMKGRDGAQIVSLKFTCPPFEDTKLRDIEVRLLMNTEHGAPRLKLRIVALDAIKRAVQGEIEARIQGRDGLEAVRIFVGAIKHQ